jgi:hypothetical protein
MVSLYSEHLRMSNFRQIWKVRYDIE